MPGQATLDRLPLEEEEFSQHLQQLKKLSSHGKTKEEERHANALLKQVHIHPVYITLEKMLGSISGITGVHHICIKLIYLSLAFLTFDT